MKKRLTLLLAGLLVVLNINSTSIVAEEGTSETGGEQTEETTEYNSSAEEEIQKMEEENNSEEKEISEEENNSEEKEISEEEVPEEEKWPKLLTWQDEKGKVSVKAQYEEGTFTDDVELQVEKIEKTSQEHKDVEDILGDSDKEYTEFLVFDISFSHDGAEIEPQKEVNINISLSDDLMRPDEDTVELIHIKESGELEVLDDAVINQDITEIEFVSDSFSSFVIAKVSNGKPETLMTIDTEGWTEDKTQFIIGYEEDGITPKLASGFYQIDDKIYYFDPENESKIVVNESREIEGKYYYFDESGVMLKDGWNPDKTRYHDENGAAISGLKDIEGKTYYFDSENENLAAMNETKQFEGKYYFFKEDGSMLKGGWNADKTRFHDRDGSAVTGFHKIGNYRYRFDESTAEITRGWMEIQPGVKAFFDGSGRMSFGFNKIGNYYYYFDTNGGIIYGDHKIGAYYYHFDEVTGRRLSGWRTVSGKTYFYDPNGRLCYGYNHIGANYYYFEPGSGELVKNAWVWVEKENKASYFKNDGIMARGGYVKINGYSTYFDSNGKGAPTEAWVKKYVKSRYYYIKVNRKQNTLTVYTRDYKGNFTIPVKAFICATGKRSTPTFTGTGFSSRWTNKWYYFPDHKTFVQYPTYFEIPNPSYPNNKKKNGKYMFHSLIYEPNTLSLRKSSFNSIGTSASSGCVRLYLRDAKWIYDHFQDGSTIVIYEDSNPGPLGKPAKITNIGSQMRWEAGTVRL